MKLPDILIIGAMKAGTTSLYMDLAQHPHVFFQADKEPHSLCSDDVLTPDGLQRYAALYAKAEPGQRCCDASTGYTKLPDFAGVPARATQLLPAGFQAIYLVRHPIDRIVSHHHHEYFAGQAGPSIDDEIRTQPRYIQYSRYYDQLTPWVDAIGRDRILVVRFEDYVERRPETMERICQFLGLNAAEFVDREAVAYNKSQGKPVLSSVWRQARESGFYRRIVRPLMPSGMRQAVRGLLLPKAKQELPKLSAEGREFLRQQLAEDVGALSRYLNLSEPLWDGY
ncbi:sulfotransferase family protein [Lacipirellula sp.]|uniref:sulfotransferase family protein n=1 Tax=Lacipirellula sp. TaxID=2691419 RepID=UPI003D0C6369